MANNQKQELGALWKRVSKGTGNEFFTGNIRTPGGEYIEIIAFNNDRKEKDTHPDIRLYISDNNQSPRGGGYQGNNYQGGNNYQRNNQSNNNYQRPQNSYSRNNNAAPAPKKEDPMEKVEYPTGPTEDPDDIPF